MMLLPAVVDYAYGDFNWEAFTISASVTIFIGLLLTFANRPSEKIVLSVRETFLLTATTWMTVSLFAALPFILSNATNSYTDSFFETISGLTTTGATVITGLDFQSPGIVLWRALLQWFGGIGIIVMALTVMPILKIGGMQLFRSEFSDRSEKVMPRVSQIANAILFAYVFLTFLCAGLLYVAGMNFLEAICHALSTLSTGGFSTSDSSIGYFNSPVIEGITTCFMLIGAITLILFVQMLQGKPKVIWQDSQARTFLLIVLASVIAITCYRYSKGTDLLTALRESSFNVASIITTTGFTAGDFSLWGMFPLMVIFITMMIGGCTGSTSGGIKIMRYQIMFIVAKTQFQRMRRPHGVFVPLYNGTPLPEGISTSVFTFFALYILCLGLLVLGLSLYNYDFTTTLSAAVSALNNIGPGFGPSVGPSGNFASLDMGAKWMLMIGMMLGRLEYITFLILLMPSFWRD